MAGTDVEMDLLDELRRLRRNQVQENQQLQTRIQELENLVYSNGGGSTGASKQSGGEIVEKVDELEFLKRENYNLKLRLGLAEFPGRTYDKDKIAKAEAHAAYVLEYERKKSNIFGENKTDDDEAAKKVLVAKEGEETNMTKEMMEEANKKKQKKGLFKKVAHGHSGVWCFCCKGKGLLFCCTFSNKIRPSPSESGRPPLISTPSEYLDRQLSAGKQEGTGNSFQNSQLPYRPMKEVLNNPDGSKFKKSNIPKSFAGKKWSPPAEHTNQHDFVWTSYDVEFGPGPLGMKLNIHPDAKGCFVHHVEPGSQADMAKVTVNEKISTVGGVKISGAHDAIAELKKQSRPVVLTFLKPSWRDIEIPNDAVAEIPNDAVANTSEKVQAARILKAQALRLSSPTTMTVKHGVKRKRLYFEEELYRNERGTYWIGNFSPSARKERLGRFMQKRKKRNWQERAVLDVPKRPATCLRFKGRFITKHGEELLRAAMEIC